MPGYEETAFSFVLVEPNETFYLSNSFPTIKNKIQNAKENEFIPLFQNNKYGTTKIMVLKKSIKGYGEI